MWKKHTPSVPTEFSLSQNYPNPFNPVTTIKYTIPTPPASSPLVKGRNEVGFVTLKVYDILGSEIVTLVDEEQSPGNYKVEFKSTVGSLQLASGIYFYRIQVVDPVSSSGQGFTETKKMILLK